MEHSTSTPNERVWRITQLAKLSFNHQSVVLTADVFHFLYWHITRFSFGMCVTWIPGVTQVDEKGHEGNTAVVTAYLCWRKHDQRNGRTGGVPVDYVLLFTLNFIRPVTMETRCFHKKLEFQRYPPKDFCTARYEHKSSKKKFQTFQKPRKK